jgi:hypothetical protein
MFDLKKNAIETIENCNKDEDCNKLMFLDAGSVSFKIITPDLKREYRFDEIYPLNEDNEETIDLRFQAQKLITIIYEHIDLNQRFFDLFKRLPRGSYNYYQASGHSIVTIKNKKR